MSKKLKSLAPSVSNTLTDDCPRYRILSLYPQKNQWTSHTLFRTLQTTLPFPIRKLQVDNVLHSEVKKPEQTHLSC